MKNRQIVQRLLMTLGIAMAFWAAGASRASAQAIICDPETEDFEYESEDCTVTFTTGPNSQTFVFTDGNNSINIKANVPEPVVIEVELIPIDLTTYNDRVSGTPFADSQCWPTLNGGCAFYRVHATPDLVLPVEYIIGFTDPAVKGNKHDLMLLRSEDEVKFDTEITTKVLRNYKVGQDDPGVRGKAPGFSDYIVAYQRVRPASK